MTTETILLLMAAWWFGATFAALAFQIWRALRETRCCVDSERCVEERQDG